MPIHRFVFPNLAAAIFCFQVLQVHHQERPWLFLQFLKYFYLSKIRVFNLEYKLTALCGSKTHVYSNSLVHLLVSITLLPYLKKNVFSCSAYISAARRVSPCVPRELEEYIASAYSGIRQEEAKSSSPHSYTTVRTLLSILRISAVSPDFTLIKWMSRKCCLSVKMV